LISHWKIDSKQQILFCFLETMLPNPDLQEFELSTPSASNVDDAIDQALRGRTRILFKPPSEQFSNDCSKCRRIENLYQLSCMHLICRTCLHVLKTCVEINCETCNKSTLKKSIVKFHSVVWCTVLVSRLGLVWNTTKKAIDL